MTHTIRNRCLTLAVIVAVPGAWPAAARAQTPLRDATYRAVDQTRSDVTLYELVLRDGSHLFGNVDSQDDRDVVFKTQAGATVTVNRSDIVSLCRVTGQLVGGEFQRPDPNRTRLFFGPTARSLKQGETYLGVYEFMLPFVQVGLTDRISFGGGTPLVFGAGTERPFWITPKIQVLRTDAADVAVGMFQGFGLDDTSGGVAYVVGTRTRPGGSFTAGAGIAYNSDGGRSAVVMLGGERPLGRGTKFITEDYFAKGGGVASAGIRFFGQHLSADLALATPIGVNGFYLFPVVNFVRVF
jgi:hypothetical protein